MQRIPLLVFTLFALALFGGERASSQYSPNPPSDLVEVVRAEFGLFNMGKDGKFVFVPSKAVPLKFLQGYGWEVTLKTTKPKVKWREELTLPSAPAIWGKLPEEKIVISTDRKVSVTEREEEPARGVISNGWAVAVGDPKGKYLIRLTIEDASPIVFEFNVE